MAEPEYVGIEEAAEMLGVSAGTLRNHFAVRSKTFVVLRPSRVPGLRRWRIARAAIREALERGAQEASGKVLPLPRRTS